MAWTCDTWRKRAREAFESAMRAGHPYADRALEVSVAHAGRENWAWDLLPLVAVKAIWRDCSRITQFEEAFQIAGDISPALVPLRRSHEWLFSQRNVELPQQGGSRCRR